MSEQEQKKAAEIAAAKLHRFIEEVTGQGGFKKLAALDEIRGALTTLCVCAQVDLIAGNPVFSQPSKQSNDTGNH